jgi:LPS O-antigen subunit length determinant protein (WzzB/FepE family)
MKKLTSREKTWIAPLALLAVFATTGCPASTTVKAPETEIKVTMDATKESLLASYNHTSSAITALNLSVDLVPSAGKAYSGIIQQYHEVSAFILAKRPAEVRMIGQVLSKNIFDMTSDGETFHIFIPSKNKFMVGSSTLERPAEKPIENIRPQHLLDALFWPEIPAAGQVIIAEHDELTARYYVLSVLTSTASPEIERNLWFDRSDLHLARIQIYGPAGKLVSNIRLDSWQAAALPTSSATVNGSLEFPRHITMQRPHDDYKLEIKVRKVTLNESISDDRFQLQQPPGSELVKVGEASPGKQQ